MDAIIQPSSSKLNDVNYHLWKLRTESTLKAKDAWIAIEKDDPGNDVVNARAKIAWDKACNVAMGYMTNSIEDSVLGQFINVASPKDLWNKIKDKYEANNNVRKIELRNAIAALRMQTAEDWKTYILRATNLGEQAKAMGLDVSDHEIAYNIVRGLPSRYQVIKTSFGAQPVIDVDLLKRALREQDETTGRRQEIESAYKAKTNTQNGKAKVRCWNCNKFGHRKVDCWKLHGKNSDKEQCKKSGNKQEKDPHHSKNAEARVSQGMPERGEQAWFTDISLSGETDSDVWLLDSGATSHMCSRRDWLSEFSPQKNCVKLADEGTTEITGKGVAQIISRETGKHITIEDVLYVPNLRGNLLSVGKIVQKTGNTIIFDRERAVVQSERGETIATAKNVGEFYFLQAETLVAEVNKAAANEKNEGQKSNADLEAAGKGNAVRGDRVSHSPKEKQDETKGEQWNKLLWHKRLNHLNENAMNQIVDNNMVDGINFGKEKYDLCHACNAGKLAKQAHRPIGQYQSRNILELLHMDLCGPFPVESHEGFRYILTVVDDFSRKIFTYFLKTKDQTTERIGNFIAREERRTGKLVKNIRTDNGGEFINYELKTMLDSKGIKHQLTTPYSPQSNGIAERTNRTILEAVRTLLIESGLPNEFWVEAAKTASYVKNACPTKINGNETPHEKYTGCKPTAKHFRVFGCLAYYHIPREKRATKLAPSGKAGIFVGYSRGRQAYRVFDPEEGRFRETKHVKFHENKKGSTLLKEHIVNADLGNLTYDFIQLGKSRSTEGNYDEEHHDERERLLRPPPRRSERIRLQNLRKGAPFYNEALEEDTDEEEQHDEQIHKVHDKGVVTTPTTFKEAMSSPYAKQWVDAMQEEINSLKQHGAWELVKRPKEVKTIPSKWVYKVKKNPDGSIERFKARLVAVGCSQGSLAVPETFSPVVKHESLRTLLAVAKMKDYLLKIYDVNTAYLYGQLNEYVVLEQPEGFMETTQDDMVCKLKRGLYGLKQSGRIWYETLRDHLLNVGYKQLDSDPCIFRYEGNNGVLWLAIYVDDMIAIGTNKDAISEGIQLIQRKFNLTDATSKSTILGWNIKWKREELILTQETYAKEILQRFNMADCKPVSTPLDPGQNLNEFQDSPKVNITLYQEMVGSIMYLVTGTRPDLSFAVTKLSKYLSDPREIHLRAAKRTLRYIKGTTEIGLAYNNTSGQLTGYADASWNDGNADEKSITGYVIQVGSNTLHWKSRKQRNVSTSTCQSEITAIADCMKDMMWFRGLLMELNCHEFLPTKVAIYNDNQAAITSTQTVASYHKMRHYVRTVLFVRQQVELGNYEIKYISGENLCADAFTKPVTASKLAKTAELLNVK